MSGNERYFLDTNAVVFLLQGRAEHTHLLSTATWVGVSIITEIEFLAFPNMTGKDIQLFERFLGKVDVIDLCHGNTTLTQQVIELRSTFRIKLPDAVIVSSALIYRAKLITNDQALLKLNRRINKLEILAC